ncbi:MAG: deoxyhypusine synthase family protein [bacterium]|nr:deoxyhypusine synthase family protein [bacterium]
MEINHINKFLRCPTNPFEIKPDDSIYEVLNRMGDISFQGRNLSLALKIWERMLKDKTMIFLGLAGAMIPAGMRQIIVYLIKNRYIDCLVATGANLFHDIHEIIGRYHYLGTSNINDVCLRKEGVDRIYDTFASEKEFLQTDNFIGDFAYTLEEKNYSTREFFYLLGQRLNEFPEQGILNTAASCHVPVYCPALGDSSIGIALCDLAKKRGRRINFDIIKDVEETTILASTLDSSAVIYVGGGTPKNFIQQTEVVASCLGLSAPGHKYAVQFTQDSPQWGGLSGCTFEEAQSWGKIAKDARMVTVHVDATIALPILITALAQAKIKRKKVPQFNLENGILINSHYENV